MKIEGFTKGLLQRDVTIERPDGPLTLKLTALPIGFMEQLERDIPSPVPKQIGWLRTRGNRGSFIKGSDGRMVPELNNEDPKFKLAEEIARRLQNILCITEALRGESKIEFATKLAGSKSRLAYAEGLLAEFLAFGFSFGDLGKLVVATIDVSGVTGDKIQAARESFLSEDATLD